MNRHGRHTPRQVLKRDLSPLQRHGLRALGWGASTGSLLMAGAWGLFIAAVFAAFRIIQMGLHHLIAVAVKETIDEIRQFGAVAESITAGRLSVEALRRGARVAAVDRTHFIALAARAMRYVRNIELAVSLHEPLTGLLRVTIVTLDRGVPKTEIWRALYGAATPETACPSTYGASPVIPSSPRRPACSAR